MSNKEKMVLNSVMSERVRTHDADYWANRQHWSNKVLNAFTAKVKLKTAVH